jgi:hypothetical protein
MPSENLDLLKYLSGGIPVAFFALLLLIVLWRERGEREKVWEARLAAKDVVIEAKDQVIDDLNARLLQQANDYSDEMLATHSRLHERMLTQWTENAPLFKQSVEVLKQAVAELAVASANRQAGRG